MDNSESLGGDAVIPNAWKAISASRPILKAGLATAMHCYRGKQWWVIRDNDTHRVFRVPIAAVPFVSELSGEKNVEQIYQGYQEWDERNRLSQEEILGLLNQLESQGLLTGLHPLDLEKLAQRRKRQMRMALFSKYGNPASFKLPLFDPTRFGSHLQRLSGWIYTPWMFAVWFALVVTSALLALMHWREITDNLNDQFFSVENALLGLCVYVLIKAVHEFAHVLAIGRYGGRCKEVGLLFIAFVPVPYVDASQSALLPNKWHRVWVSLAGIQSELLLAALATFVWLTVEPGVIRAAMYNVMMIGWINTVLLNGNPLQRFDGYFALQDSVELPNLATRSANAYSYLAQYYLLGKREAAKPDYDKSEWRWFLLYWPASWLFRAVIMVTIALYLAEHVPFIGWILALWTLMQMFAIPLIKFIVFMNRSKKETPNAPVVRRGVVLTLILLALIGLVPLPNNSVVQGVVWLPEANRVRAQTSGFVDIVHVERSTSVSIKQPLITLQAPMVHLQRDEKQAHLLQLQKQYDADLVDDRVRAVITKERINQVKLELAELGYRLEQLSISAPVAGIFVALEESVIPGSYLEKGDTIGEIQPDQYATVKAVVPMEQIDLVRESLLNVEVRSAHQPFKVSDANIARLAPGATHTLPSEVLTIDGGGEFAVKDAQTLSTHQLFYIADIRLAQPEVFYGGERVSIRFQHQYQPLFAQVTRLVRQTLLRRLDV
ncbi:site-2 protease family protein [Vibrio rhodolitus]|uniref:site-2 protease family protein n=1 Tax=Vibrio rhodolitus TaxID=2231649 RepID=UPI001FCA10F9|nr:site-2 protease family protein [Vibrio rhodolitus]